MSLKQDKKPQMARSPLVKKSKSLKGGKKRNSNEIPPQHQTLKTEEEHK